MFLKMECTNEVFEEIQDLVRENQQDFELFEHKPIRAYAPAGYHGKRPFFPPKDKELAEKEILALKINLPPTPRHLQELLLSTEGDWLCCAFSERDPCLYFHSLSEEEVKEVFKDASMPAKILGLLSRLRAKAIADRQREIWRLEKGADFRT